MIKRALLSLVACCAIACSAPDPSAREVATPPDATTFPSVANYLDHRCGSLDCHGSDWRNLRLYGVEGRRFDANDRPYFPPTITNPELDADLRSIVALEPEVISAVVADHGASPERLTLVRKARGLDDHKGGAMVQPGDDGDTCITSWLASKTDSAACTRALSSTP
jgi:hypothetical protein